MVGMALGTWLGSPFLPMVLWCTLGLAGVGGVASVWYRSATGLIVVGLLVLVGSAWALLYGYFGPQPLASSVELTARRAVIVSPAEPVGQGWRAYLDLELPTGISRVRATWPNFDSEWQYGQVVTVSGQVIPPRSDHTVAERGFLLAHGASGSAQLSQVVDRHQVAGAPILRLLYQWQRWLVERLNQQLHYPYNLVMSGILLGYRSGLPSELEDAFRRTGTSHILVASGSNVVILAATVGVLLSSLGWRRRTLLLTIILLGFIVITGADASVIRASIFYELTILARLSGRRIHPPTLVSVVGLLMTLTNPWILLYDIAFQLSFAAILGLLVFEDLFQVSLPAWIAPKVLAPTLSAQLGTLPVLIYHFGQVSLIAPLVNALVVPMVEAVMLGGLATILFPWIRIIPWIANGVTGLLVWIVTTSAALPSAAVTLSAQRGWWSGGAVLIVVSLALLRSRLNRTWKEIDATH